MNESSIRGKFNGTDKEETFNLDKSNYFYFLATKYIRSERIQSTNNSYQLTITTKQKGSFV